MALRHNQVYEDLHQIMPQQQQELQWKELQSIFLYFFSASVIAILFLLNF